MNKFPMLAVSALLCAAFSSGAYAAGGEIAVIVKTVNSNYWQNVQKGANAALANEKGYTMTFQGPAAESDITDEVNMVGELVIAQAMLGQIVAFESSRETVLRNMGWKDFGEKEIAMVAEVIQFHVDAVIDAYRGKKK